MGGALMLLFFASIGMEAARFESLRGCGWLVAFILIQLGAHTAVVMAAGHVLRRWVPRSALLVASNAAVGGPATAAAMATSRGWSELLQPAMLAGSFGYAIGTGVGCAVGYILLRLS
mmetsp:Transcript_38591/g.122314  ORF Transcript_38591/g.122314 Transcript_38591/m.122314 type:complete len:117 (+) Transcript_38591:336-686(+)